jgi:O-acetyl-ADP-ribose deacetylase
LTVTKSCQITLVAGDLLDQDVEVIVNPWNRNVIPWWLLWPHGVSGAIKRRAGTAPFRELRQYGVLLLGHAVMTSAGRLPYRAIIHVAGIDYFWRASETSVRLSVCNALKLAAAEGVTSIAFPIIGSGSGGLDVERAKGVMMDELQRQDPPLRVIVVEYRKGDL